MKKTLLGEIQDRFPSMPKKELYARVLCGEVLVDDVVERDPKRRVGSECEISFGETGYVSRGGRKLAQGLIDHGVDPRGRVVLDAGASTGGFTECLLERGARVVHAVDVGYNQLHYRLRQDARVVVHERCNIMDVDRLDPLPDLAVADLSFRSLRGAAVHILNQVRDRLLLALIKPQFEWLDPPASFDGVVRRREDIVSVLEDLAVALSVEGVRIEDISESPITGRRGNREFFFRLSLPAGPGATDPKLPIKRFFASAS